MARTRTRPYLGAGLAAHAGLQLPEAEASLALHGGANIAQSNGSNTDHIPDPFAPTKPLVGRFIEFAGTTHGSILYTDPAGNSYKVLRSAQQCPPGSTWDVVRFAITDGASPFTFVGAHTGDGWVFAGNSDSDYTVVGLRDIVAQMPSVAFYALGQFIVYSGQRIFFLLENGTATNYGFSGTALQRPSGIDPPTAR
jgi:hypothetical protein